MAHKRSPAYPAYSLSDSIRFADDLFKSAGEHFTALDAVASIWGLSPLASGFMQRVSTLKQYGLLEEKGAKASRELKLTELALDILLHEEKSKERKLSLAKSALTPPIHKELWEKYNGKLPPEDSAIKAYLLRSREGATFNVKQVDAFIDRFRAAVSLSNVKPTDKIQEMEVDSNPSTSNNGNGLEAQLQVGSFVQWTSQGVDQFNEPRKVVAVESGWALVEGSNTGVPVSELSIADPPKEKPESKVSADPFSNLGSDKLKPGMKHDKMALGDCEIIVNRPAKMTPDVYEELESMFELVLRNAKRAVVKEGNAE